jgi:hypothetical protein
MSVASLIAWLRLALLIDLPPPLLLTLLLRYGHFPKLRTLNW